MSKVKTKQFTDADFVIQPQEPVELPETVAIETALGSGFVIEERDVPKRSGRKSSLSYPIDKLEPGSKQSFLVRATPDKLKNTLSSVRTYAFRNDFRVTLRTEVDGVRVWRKAVV